jgi:putative membrane protein
VRLLAWLVISWLANALVLAIVTWILKDVTCDTTGNLLLAAAVFGVLNTILKPILRLITLPFAVVTLGLVWFFVSMLMLWLTSKIVSGFDIHGFWTLVWATIMVWVVNLVLDVLGRSWAGPRAEPA